jgi:pentatricopeptide repeat protein
MYSKCGDILKSEEIFYNLIKNKNNNIEINVITFNIMISNYGEHGKGKESIKIFNLMNEYKIKPNEITFINLLNSCSHSKLINEGIEFYNLMENKYNIKPNEKHITCMIDLFGRSGNLEKAEEFSNKIPNNIIGLKTLLGSCRIYNNIEIGERIANKLFLLENYKEASTYILLSNIYSQLNLIEKQKEILELKDKNKVKKIPGITTIEINGKLTTFTCEDDKHPKKNEIYNKIYELFDKMKNFEGFKFDKSFATRIDLETDEEKENHLCLHSEKIALSFGLLETPKNSIIKLIKNLRVCGDCHNATKLISKIENREIIMRDLNRFHHFKDGKCSCNDYF